MSLLLARGRGPSPISFLVALVLLGGFMTYVRGRMDSTPGATVEVPLGADGFPLEEGACADGGSGCGATGAAGEVLLEAAEACVNVGYLCADVERNGSLRIMRWPVGSGPLRIRVPSPASEEPARARALQRAAVQGIMAWHGHPFEFIIDDRSQASGPADVEVRWASQLSGRQLGVTQVDWRKQGDEVRFRVLGLRLATRSPFNFQAALEPRQVRLTAAHEMGHALGLPHSDRPRDLMYPQNTATSLSARDYRTLETVYGLENGVVIRK